MYIDDEYVVGIGLTILIMLIYRNYKLSKSQQEVNKQ